MTEGKATLGAIMRHIGIVERAIKAGPPIAKSETLMIQKAMARRTLETLSFDNTYARLPQAFYTKLNPTSFGSPPYLVHANSVAAELIDLDPEQFIRLEFSALFGGSALASRAPSARHRPGERMCCR